MKYYDKNGNQIKEGMTIKHNEGDVEKVYSCGDNDLGVNADNPNYVGGELGQCYPLHQFDLKEWEIVRGDK